MCFTSLVMQEYQPYIPPHWPYSLEWKPYSLEWKPFTPTKKERYWAALTENELRMLINSYRQAIAAAEQFDELTGQPDCHDDSKLELEQRIAALERQLNDVRQ